MCARKLARTLLLLLLATSACRGGAPGVGEEGAAQAAVLQLTVKAEAPGQSFRYFDPAAGQFRTALKADEIPAAARRLVMVTQEGLPPEALKPGEMVLADLSQPRDDGSFPWRVVSMARTEAQVTGRPASAGAAGHPTGAGVAQPEAHVAGVSPGSRLPIGDRVLLFATTWCPHCREAEQYLKARGVAFQRLDVEAEPGARDLLLRLFKEGGIPAQYANTVPILYVKGQVLMGFDRAELEKLL